MINVNVVDARMGRGKTAAAIRMMKENRKTEHYLYVTNYPEEVADLCTPFGYETEHLDEYVALKQARGVMDLGGNVAIPPTVFRYLDGETLAVTKRVGYTLIVDGPVDMMTGLNASRHDTRLLLEDCVKVGDGCKVRWVETYYAGNLSFYKRLCDLGSLYCYRRSFMWIMNPSVFQWFKETWFLTYLFKGSLLCSYLKHFNIQWLLKCIEIDREGPHFADGEDNPPVFDFGSLIHIAGEPPINLWEISIANKRTKMGTFSYDWHTRQGYTSTEMRKAREQFYGFMNRYRRGEIGSFMWTTFDGCDNLWYNRDKRPPRGFMPIDATRVPGEGRADVLAYLANVFRIFTVNIFLADHDGAGSSDIHAAITSLLNFIWKSAVRDGKPIVIYLPSTRMKNLLVGWIARQNHGYSDAEWRGIAEEFPGAKHCLSYSPKVVYDENTIEQGEDIDDDMVYMI